MKAPYRRLLLQAALAAGFATLARVGLAQKDKRPRVIDITARRFSYTPSEIHMAAGEQVVLAFHALDFVHGMRIPDLGIRRDLLPGLVIELPLGPLAPGVYGFLCDNFCGDGHEDMQGSIVVGT